ncbi:hypothetical protein AB4476_01430, partial [Vibrio splendidus]
MGLNKGMIRVNFILLLTLFFSSFSHSALINITHVSNQKGGCDVSVGQVAEKGYYTGLLAGKTCYVGSTSKNNCWISGSKAYCNRGSGKSDTLFIFSQTSSCPSGTDLDPETGRCENQCKKLEGNKLGTVTFPEGTRDVASLCRNSCKAKSDLFFPAANPPYGIFTYTGKSCDGSESSGGGETGGDGSTGGD